MTSDRDEEILRRLRATFDAFNRGDFDAAMEFMHPDIEFRRVGAEPPLRGVDQVRAWMEPASRRTFSKRRTWHGVLRRLPNQARRVSLQSQRPRGRERPKDEQIA